MHSVQCIRIKVFSPHQSSTSSSVLLDPTLDTTAVTRHGRDDRHRHRLYHREASRRYSYFIVLQLIGMDIVSLSLLKQLPNVSSTTIVRGSRPGKQVQLAEYEIKFLCTSAREVFINQPILLELEAPIKICGMLGDKFHSSLSAKVKTLKPSSPHFLTLLDLCR